LNAIELTKGFKKVREPTDFRDVWPYYESYAATRPYTTFYMSPMFQCASKDYFHGIVRGCLCILKKRRVHIKNVMHLRMPPIHPQGDLAIEQEVMEIFNKAGIPTIMTDGDYTAYGLPTEGRAALPVTDSEYQYRAGDLATTTERQKRARKSINQLGRNNVAQVWRGGVDDPFLTPDEFDQCGAIALGWRTHRTKASSSKLLYFPKSFNQWSNEYPGRYRCWMLVKEDGKILYYCITEQVSEKVVVIVTALRDFDDIVTVRNPLWAEMQGGGIMWAGVLGADAWMNSGNAMTEGLAATKRRFRPHTLVGTYKHGAFDLTHEVFQATCKD